MKRVLSIYIDPDICTWSQACVDCCPEVLDGDTEDGVPQLRAGAEQYFESHFEQIKEAADVCPVEAIILETEGE
jgi:ferredoxin